MHRYPKKCQIHHFNEGIYASRNVCVKDIDSEASMVLQNYQIILEMTSNMIHIFALGVGFNCLRKIHLNTQCPRSIICRHNFNKFGKNICKKNVYAEKLSKHVQI